MEGNQTEVLGDSMAPRPVLYPERPPAEQAITEALQWLNDPSGSTYVAILERIEDLYFRDLPASYKLLLPKFVRRMVRRGELIAVGRSRYKLAPDTGKRKRRWKPIEKSLRQRNVESVLNLRLELDQLNISKPIQKTPRQKDVEAVLDLRLDLEQVRISN